MTGGDLIHETPIKGLVSIFSGNEKKGHWELPRHMRVVAIFGGAKIDLRNAVVLPGVSVIETFTICGGIEVVVPPHINVECDGDAMMGAFTLTRSKKGPASVPPPSGAPLVRVIGDAYMGAVNVQVKAPREKALDQIARKIRSR